MENPAQTSLSVIRDMLAAVAVDYDRLEELREERDGYQTAVFDAIEAVERADTEPPAAPEDACEALEDAEYDLRVFGTWHAEELAELEEAAGDCADEDDARQRIQDDPLSLRVRSGWYSPGEEPPAPAEFELLLSTGGPAVRIVGELSEHGEPVRAWIEWQDWGTPWTHHYEPGAGDTCLEYASYFYFGS